MTAPSTITREQALATLATQDINEIIKPELTQSAALAAFRTIRMTAGTTKMPVLSALPTAGFVTQTGNAATDAKPTSRVSWTNKDLVAEEIAVIIPIHENTLADSKFDLWAEIRPLVAQEFGRVLDEAVFFGKNKPTTWTDPALVPGAITAQNKVVENASQLDLAEDINDAFGFVENDEFDVNAVFTGRFLRAELRSLRDKNNHPIYIDGIRGDGNTTSIYGQNLHYLGNRAWDKTQALCLVGDASKVIIGIREDVQVKLLDQATIGTGSDAINLAERDMVALRFKFRVAYATAFSTAGGKGTEFPFAVVTPDPSGSINDDHGSL